MDPVEKLEILAASVPPSIVKGSFSDAIDRLLAVLADARSALAPQARQTVSGQFRPCKRAFRLFRLSPSGRCRLFNHAPATGMHRNDACPVATISRAVVSTCGTGLRET